MDKKMKLRNGMAVGLALAMSLSSVPYNVFANRASATAAIERVAGSVKSPQVDAASSATYYTKANWDNRIKDKSRWKVEDDQNLVRVSGSDPLEMNDIDYDGMFINANGRYVIRLVYKEKSQAVSAVWHRAIINFGDLDKYIDFNNSYVVGRDGETKYKFDPLTGTVGRGFDLRSATGDRTNNRKNLPINLVLKDGVTLDNLPKENFIVQMRITNSDYKRVYAYAPKGTSMDYSTYTKTTSVSLLDKVNNLFIKGGLQSDSNNATNQEFFMSEFIANPDQYKDVSNTGIIRTQYMGQRAGSAATPTVGDEPIAFTQVFDANLLNYLKEDDDGYVAYVKVLTDGRVVSPYSKNFGIKRDQINVTKDADGNELAYLVIGTADFKKQGVKVVEIPQHDQYTMLSGFYITAIDYVVDKSKFEETFAGKTEGIDRTRKLNYTMMSGWTNPNPNGWAVYEKPFTENFVVQEGESFMIDAGADAKGKQIMLKVGGEQGMIRKPQGYYNGYNSGKSAIDNFEEIADGVFKIGLREGATVKKGQNLKIYMPYTSSYNGSVNFLQMHNGTKRNEGAATLTLQKDRNINMHLYTGLPRGASFKLKYTLKDGTEQKELVFTKPKGLGTFWQYTDSDRVLTGIPNTSLLATAGNFYIDTTKLEPGKDIIVEAYDEKGNIVADKTSSFKYINIDKANEAVKYLTWTDHSDKKAVLSINKSLYTPYQVLFTNDYADGVDDFYKDPRVLPADNGKFNTPTTQILGYTRYDGGKVRTLYEGPQKLFGKVEAVSDDYDDNGNLKTDNHTKVTIKRENVFDPQFTGAEKTYKGYAYTFDLNKMLPYHSDDKTATKLELKKDMKFVSNASDGSSLPSDLLETRVRARVLFDGNGGKLEGDKAKEVKIVPDNINFYGEKDYKANGFEGANVEEGTGDKFPEAPKLEGKNFLGWVTEEGKNQLGSNTTTVEKFNNLPKEQVFNAETPVSKHLVVYAIYSEEKAVTFDANGGKFDNKEQIIVKTDNNTVKAPTENPTKTGYTFKGWASTKDATEADADILKNVSGSKTVYAVWVKDAEDELNLTPPAQKVPVQDKTDLTEGEKTKVKDAVKEANIGLDLTNDDITVEKDGKVIVNKGNKTGEIPADQTVTQKEVLNDINPPAKPVEVNNPKALEEGEKDKVKQAIIDANPDLKLTKDDITVDSDGKVTVNKGGKVGEVPAKDTVVETDKVIKLTAPEKVEVKDTNNLTKPEREKVEEAVKAANKTKLSESAVVTVDASGNVTVIDGDKKGTLDADKTIKPFDRTGKTLNDPKELTEVSDKEHLTEAEKQAVREAVKAANPDLAFKNSEIQVADNGKVTVPMGKNESGDPIYKEIAPEKTVKNDDANTTISLKAPKKTFVKDPSSLTQDDKNAVIAAVKAANSSLPADAKIEVANDGSVTVTSGKKVGTLAQADTVVKKLLPPKAATDEDGGIVVAPRDPRTSEIQVTYTDPSGQKQTVIAKKDTDGKWKIDPAVDGVTVNEDSGLISIPTDKIKDGADVKAIAKDGDNISEGNTVKSEDKQAPAAPEVVKNDDGNITVTPPKDKDTKTVTIKYTDKDGNPKEVKATKGDDGTWTVPDESGLTVENGKIIVPAEKTKPGTKVSASATDGNNNTSSEVDVTTPSMADDNEPKVPAKTTVANPDKLTEKEQEAVKKAIEEANKNHFPQAKEGQNPTKVEVGKDGTATITYPDGSQDKITGYRLVEKDTTAPGAPTVKAEDNGDVKITPPTDADTKEVEVSYVPTGKTEPVKVTATKDPETGKWSVPANSGLTVDENGNIIIPADKVADDTEVSAKAIDTAGNESTPTDTSKAKAKNPAGEGKVSVDENKKKAVDPTAEKQGTGVIVKNHNKATVSAVDEDGNNVPVEIDSTTGEIKVTPGTNVDGPIKVTVKDNAGVEKVVSIEVNGHTEGVDDNNSTPDATAPGAPTVKANDDGTVSITPATDGKTKSVTVKYTDPQGNEKTVTATKDGDAWTFDPASSGFTIDGKGNIVIPKDQVKPGTEVSATAKDANEKESTAGTAKVPTLADKFTPEYTEADAQAGSPTTITGPNFKDKGGQDTTKPSGTTFKLGNGAPTGASIDKNGKITYTPTDADAGKDITIPVVVKYSDGSTDTVNVTVKVVPKSGQETGIKAPNSPITVDNAKALTDADKKKVADAVKTANPNLPEGSTITVADDGTVTIKDKTGTEIGKLKPEQTVKQNDSKLAVKAPEAVEVADPENVTEAERGKIKEAIKKANPDLADATIEVDNKGNVTVTKGGKTGTLTPAQTIKKADALVAPANPVDVKDPSNLTKEEKAAVEKAVKDANPTLPADAKVTVADDGTVTVTDKDGKEIGKLTPEQTVKNANTAPVIKRNNDGSITVWPPADATEVTVKYTGADGLPKDVKLTKDAGKWVAPQGSDLIVDPATGKITIPGNKIQKGSDVLVIAKNGLNQESRAVSKGTTDNTGNHDGSIWLTPVNPSVDNKANDKKAEKHDMGIHKAYIFGYEDNTFRANGNMTRAEAAAMIARLKELDMSNKAKPEFSDVKSAWYNGSINAVVRAGYMKGYPDGTFNPNGKITRAEFAQMIMAIDKANGADVPFSDVKGHWAEAAIMQAYANGRIAGYPDKTFRPNNNITRAEAVTVLNKLFDRSVDNKGLADVHAGIAPFKDLTPKHWAYYQIIEASNTHRFFRTEKGKVDETWDVLLQTWKQALENR